MAMNFSDSKRSTGYKCGVGLLCFSSLMFLTAFVSPFWEDQYGITSGLWMVCESSCNSIGIEGQAGWFTASRVLETVALILMVICCVWAIVVNTVTRERPPVTHLLEVVAAVAGVLGFTGAIVYGAMAKNETFDNMSWAFFLATFGSLFVINSAALIARCYNDNKTTGTNQDTTGLTSVAGLGYKHYEGGK